MEQINEMDVRIEWESDEDAPPSFANQAVIAFDGATYILRLYRTLLPTELAADPGAMKSMTSIRAKHVQTIVIPEKAFAGIVRVLSETLKNTQGG